MSLFDEASLVISPNGVKEGKLYSVKPTDGSGDLDVVRATTATRVNSDGLIEVVPKNLLTYSEQFENANWVKLSQGVGSTPIVTPNYAISPDGTQNASRLQCDLNGGNTTSDRSWLYQTTTIISGDTTFSLYVKNNSNEEITFTLSNGSSETVVVLSDDKWHRLYTVRSGGGFTRIGLIGGVGASDNADLLIYGAQLEEGSYATSYIPTTDRLNVPRLDYTNGSCPSILVEPQRTNLFLMSEEFDNAYWLKTSATVIVNNTASPDGNNTADKVEFNSGFINATAIVADNQTYTISFFAKKGTANIFQISEAFYFGTSVVFDLNTGTITSGTGNIENYGNGWYRCSMQITYGVGQSVSSWVIRNYQAGYVYIWGAQLEAGSYATSYIPTVGSAVTRNADVATGAGDASTFNDSEGVLMVEASALANDGTIRTFSLSSGSSANSVRIYFSANNTINYNVKVGGVNQFTETYTLNNQKDFNKIAVKYKANDFALWVNGFEVGIISSGNTPIGLSEITFDSGDGASVFYSSTKQILYFDKALTDVELQQLTTI